MRTKRGAARAAPPGAFASIHTKGDTGLDATGLRDMPAGGAALTRAGCECGRAAAGPAMPVHVAEASQLGAFVTIGPQDTSTGSTRASDAWEIREVTTAYVRRA